MCSRDGAPGCTCSEPLTIAARTADLYFSETRDHSAAKLLLSRSLANSDNRRHVLSTDGNGSYPEAILTLPR
jgi:transposase-like protein